MSTEPGEVREEERTRPTVATPSPLRTAEAPRAAAHVQSHARTVVLEGLHAYYGDTHAVRGVSITFAANEVTAMIGPWAAQWIFPQPACRPRRSGSAPPRPISSR